MNPDLEMKNKARRMLDLGPSLFTALHIAGTHLEGCRCRHCLTWWKVAEKIEFDPPFDCPFRSDELEGDL